jgi:hypothetical protein
MPEVILVATSRKTVHGPGVTGASGRQSYRRTVHPLWDGRPARPTQPVSSGRSIREEAVGVAAPQVPADALVNVTDTLNEHPARWGS